MLKVVATESVQRVSLEVGILFQPGRIPASALDLKFIVPWYQSEKARYDIHRTSGEGRVLVESLLVNDDGLIRLDEALQHNLVKVTLADGQVVYRDISQPGVKQVIAKMSSDIYPIRDADTLQPFALPAGGEKKIWATVAIPESAAPGSYRAPVTLKNPSTGAVLQQGQLALTVYPFALEAPGVEYSLYYRGVLSSLGERVIGSDEKTEAQMRRELRNMQRFGVANPTIYQPFSERAELEKVLRLRSEVGISNRRLYYLGLTTSDYENQQFWTKTRQELTTLRKTLAKYGVEELYIYGIDEAEAERLRAQYPLWASLRKDGIKIFAATWKPELVSLQAGRVDALVCQAPVSADQVDEIKRSGTRVLLYGQPQVGVQDPPLYRLSYGLKLWQKGFDGVMNYAYQHAAGEVWNDFDHVQHRDHVFAYPTVNGLVETLPWHAFREGIDDYRYIRTMVSRVEALERRHDGAGVEFARRGREYLEDLKSEDGGNPELVRETIVRFLLATEGLQ